MQDQRLVLVCFVSRIGRVGPIPRNGHLRDLESDMLGQCYLLLKQPLKASHEKS